MSCPGIRDRQALATQHESDVYKKSLPEILGELEATAQQTEGVLRPEELKECTRTTALVRRAFDLMSESPVDANTLYLKRLAQISDKHIGPDQALPPKTKYLLYGRELRTLQELRRAQVMLPRSISEIFKDMGNAVIGGRCVGLCNFANEASRQIPGLPAAERGRRLQQLCQYWIRAQEFYAASHLGIQYDEARRCKEKALNGARCVADEMPESPEKTAFLKDLAATAVWAGQPFMVEEEAKSAACEARPQ